MLGKGNIRKFQPHMFELQRSLKKSKIPVPHIISAGNMGLKPLNKVLSSFSGSYCKAQMANNDQVS